MRVPHIIAIDGPAASGKSSVASALARRLGFASINSGALYRAVTWHVLREGINPYDVAAIGAAIEQTQIDCDLRHSQSRVMINGVDPSAHLRDDDVNRAVSVVSSVPRVREILGQKMREYARTEDVVIEGRDIGSAVFPDTPFKFYIDALPHVRVQRREAQGEHDEITSRDRIDSSRSTAPLMIAAEADVIDTSNLTITGVREKILLHLRQKGLAISR
jgi:CMP/dCMP kinase